jgi:hypothetical protein
MGNIFFFFLLVFLGEFQQESYVGMWGHYGSGIVGVFLRPLARRQAQLLISFGGIGLLSMEDYAPFDYLRN